MTMLRTKLADHYFTNKNTGWTCFIIKYAYANDNYYLFCLAAI